MSKSEQKLINGMTVNTAKKYIKVMEQVQEMIVTIISNISLLVLWRDPMGVDGERPGKVLEHARKSVNTAHEIEEVLINEFVSVTKIKEQLKDIE